MSKHILIIGGMGPQASVHAHQRLLDKFVLQTQGADNAAFPRITHLSINVDDFISDSTKQAAARNYILECLRDINLESVDIAFIACNTAHLLYDDIRELLAEKLVSMVAITALVIEPEQTGIVATPSTLRTHLYDKKLIEPTAEDSADIERIIREIIAGGKPEVLAKDLQAHIDRLQTSGAKQVLLGCTELSIIGSHVSSANTIDPIELVIDEILVRLYGPNS